MRVVTTSEKQLSNPTVEINELGKIKEKATMLQSKLQWYHSMMTNHITLTGYFPSQNSIKKWVVGADNARRDLYQQIKNFEAKMVDDKRLRGNIGNGIQLDMFIANESEVVKLPDREPITRKGGKTEAS